MNTRIPFARTSLALLTSAALLAGCGGGGGGGAASTPTASAPSSAPTVPTVPVASPVAPTAGSASQTFVPPVTEIPASSYTADVASVYRSINDLRVAAGAGVLAQATSLDTAARGQLEWVKAQGGLAFLNPGAGVTRDPHTQSQNVTTGATPAERAVAAGYAGPSAELFTANPACVRGLLASPKHAHFLLGPWRDVGIGFEALSSTAAYCYVVVGSREGVQPQLPAAGTAVIAVSAGVFGGGYINVLLNNGSISGPVTSVDVTDVRILDSNGQAATATTSLYAPVSAAGSTVPAGVGQVTWDHAGYTYPLLHAVLPTASSGSTFRLQVTARVNGQTISVDRTITIQ